MIYCAYDNLASRCTSQKDLLSDKAYIVLVTLGDSKGLVSSMLHVRDSNPSKEVICAFAFATT